MHILSLLLFSAISFTKAFAPIELHPGNSALQLPQFRINGLLHAKRGKLSKTVTNKGENVEIEKEIEESISEPKSASFDTAKLAAEISTPFRTIRLFVYGAFAASALIGGLTALTQLAASVANQPEALPLTQCLTNVGIDFGVVLVCAFCYKFELSQQVALQEKKRAEREKIQLQQQQSISEDMNNARVDKLRSLEVKLTDNAENTENSKNNYLVGTLMKEANQNMVLVSGGRTMLRDAMLRATANREIFTASNLLIVPILMADPMEVSDKGFAAKPAYFKQGFVAEPVDEESWRDLIREEMRDAERQGNGKAAKQGIVLVINKEGKVLRRGLGMPRWDMIRQDLFPSRK